MKLKFPAVALPVLLSLAVVGCGSQKADQEGKTEAAMNNEPGVDSTAAAPGVTMSEANTLAGRIASGNLSRGELAVAMEDLDRLINDNPIDFPDSVRTKLTEDLQSARAAFNAKDMQGLKEATMSMQQTLSSSGANVGAN